MTLQVLFFEKEAEFSIKNIDELIRTSFFKWKRISSKDDKVELGFMLYASCIAIKGECVIEYNKDKDTYDIKIEKGIDRYLINDWALLRIAEEAINLLDGKFGSFGWM